MWGRTLQSRYLPNAKYVKAHNLAGLFEWRMDNDMRPDNSLPTYQVMGWMSESLV
jgi:GH18 family chitinase